MFRNHFEENGITAEWQQCYRALSDAQKESLLQLVSHTITELRDMSCPKEFEEILPYYLIKYKGKKETMSDGSVQLSFLDDSDIVVEDE